MRTTARSLSALCLAAALSAQVAWVPAKVLNSGLGAALAFDAARGRVVLVPSVDPRAAFETWEWDGLRWILRSPAASPPARDGSALAYDARRGRVVLFGGQGSAGYLADTWEWDGNEWTKRSSATSPPARRDHALAWDAARSSVVLFGGTPAPTPGPALGDTWEYDGSAWTQRSSASSPVARSRHAMSYDSGRSRVLLYGGSSVGSGALADLWEWDGAVWMQRNPGPVAPPPMVGHALAYDAGRSRAVLFVSSALALPVWEWDGSAWARIVPPAVPLEAYGIAMTYDAARGRIVLHGRGMWEWDGALWTQRRAMTAPIGSGAATTFDAGHGVVVMAGSVGYQLAFEHWQWDGSGWSPRFPATTPPARGASALAYDLVRLRVVLFGGFYGISTTFADTWEWDGLDWSNVGPAVAPPGRARHALAYDLARAQTVLFGGVDPATNALRSDTWRWDGASWTLATPASRPTARYDHALAYDWARKRVVLFGGRTSGASAGVLADTWEWDGSTWLQRITTPSPPARAGHTLAYDVARNRVVLFGGFATAALADTWEWDGTSWTPVSTSVAPPGRFGHAMSYDLTRGQIVLSGGSGLPSGFETWLYGGGTAVAAAVAQPYGAACAGTGGPPLLSASLPLLGAQGAVLDLLQARASSPCAFGLSGVSQPLSLPGGCTLYLGSPAVTFGMTTNPAGFATFGIALPNDPGLRGGVVHAQAFVVDPMGVYAGVAMTGGVRLGVGY